MVIIYDQDEDRNYLFSYFFVIGKILTIDFKEQYNYFLGIKMVNVANSRNKNAIFCIKSSQTDGDDITGQLFSVNFI